jgi:hypothetical protein
MREEGHPLTTTKLGFVVVRDLIAGISFFTNALLAVFLLGLSPAYSNPCQMYALENSF